MLGAVDCSRCKAAAWLLAPSKVSPTQHQRVLGLARVGGHSCLQHTNKNNTSEACCSRAPICKHQGQTMFLTAPCS